MITRQFTGKEEREGIIARYEASGMKQREFCKQEEIKFHTLQWWLRERRKKAGDAAEPKRKGKEPKLLPIRVTDAVSSKDKSGAIEVELRSGVVLRFGENTDSGYMARLLREFCMSAGDCQC